MSNFKEELGNVSAFVFDVDGVLSNAKIYLHPEHYLMRSMNIKDGYAIQYAIRKGYMVGIITGGNSKHVETRFKNLGVKDIYLKSRDKVAYHAAAVFACNYLVTLVKLSTDLWETFRIPPEKATKALLPLLRGTLNNIDTLGIPQCLTGPIARGDIGTVTKHIKTLHKKAPALLTPYTELGRQTIPVALAKGKIDKNRSIELEKILKAS